MHARVLLSAEHCCRCSQDPLNLTGVVNTLNASLISLQAAYTNITSLYYFCTNNAVTSLCNSSSPCALSTCTNQLVVSLSNSSLLASALATSQANASALAANVASLSSQLSTSLTNASVLALNVSTLTTQLNTSRVNATGLAGQVRRCVHLCPTPLFAIKASFGYLGLPILSAPVTYVHRTCGVP